MTSSAINTPRSPSRVWLEYACCLSRAVNTVTSSASESSHLTPSRRSQPETWPDRVEEL